MKYINTTTLETVRLEQLREILGVSIPIGLPVEGYHPVQKAPKPTTQWNKKAVEVAPTLVGENWTQNWSTVDLTGDALVKASIDFQKDVVKRVQKRLDDFAATRNYDSIHTASAYSASKKTKFKVEGQYAVDAMSDTWDALYAYLNDVQSGTLPTPTSFADIESFLPTLTWPI